ncbi:membrane protein [Haematobacter massiliensis]|uniref:Membrane protein n=1 Tax=Haematobacter massiliensis TaxID=195105 RepID=A0A086Y220_9RHOB|nr:ABC transporter permease [Haematobacter massiliensis]KFI28320.1 membrane protein [Haematobacter massiliensis]OWJ84431.1 hypothetical protein CDV51_13805 [Haematobacter massiliensis]QBJ26424.1 ABC transporter permease [Haematobacter massiliensis]
MRLQNIWTLGLKELIGLLRDPIMMVLIVYSFTLSVYSSSRATPQTLNRATIGIVDEDRSQVSARIGSAFYPPYFVAPNDIQIAEMDRRMDQGLDTFALDIPLNFQQDLLAGKRPEIQLNIDATRMSQAFTGAGYIQQILSSEITEYLSRTRDVSGPAVDMVLRAKFNQQLNTSWFSAVNNVTFSITLLSIVLTGAALIREKEHGTVEHLLVMPVTALEIMLSKVWAMGLVVLVATAISLKVVVEIWLGVPLNGSLLLFLAGTVLMLFATTSLGIFLATAAGTMPQFGLLLILVLLPLQILSGGMTPRESMPEFVQNIMLGAPTTHFVMLSQAILFRGAGFNVVWPQFLALLVIGGVLFTLALTRFRAFLR